MKTIPRLLYQRIGFETVEGRRGASSSQIAIKIKIPRKKLNRMNGFVAQNKLFHLHCFPWVFGTEEGDNILQQSDHSLQFLDRRRPAKTESDSPHSNFRWNPHCF